MKALFKEFTEFINRGNLVDFAVAVLLATAFTPVVNAVVEGVVLNLIAALFGEPDFNYIRIRLRGDGATATYLEIGTVLTAAVQFLVVAVVCFFIIKAYNVAARRKTAEPGPTEVELLTEIRDSLRRSS